MTAPAAKIAGRPPEGDGVAVDRRVRLDDAAVRVLADQVAGRAEAASELSSAVPIEPPICCEVLTVAEATPASCGRTPAVAGVHRRGEDGAHAEPDQQQRAEDVRGVGAGAGRCR